MMAVMTDTHAANDLELYIANDADLQRQQGTSILKNLATKKVRSQYQHDLAVKLFGYLVESGAKKYVKDLRSTLPWHKMFDVSTRKLVAEELTKDFEGEFELGNYDYLLPKKYQKEMLAVGGKTKFPSRGHATKKISWKVPKGLTIVWSPMNSAYFAMWPASKPVRQRQVLKIADADAMDSWLRERYGAEYGRAGATPRTHSTVADAYSKKKSSSRLDREIAEVVPSWRGGR